MDRVQSLAVTRPDTVMQYQWLLRAIGHYLDRHEARMPTVIECPGGFTAVYACPAPAAPQIRDVAFTRAEMRTMADAMIAEQQHVAHRKPGRYEDFLRALGFELEQQRAYSILVSETDAGFLVTYQYLKPSQGYLVRKHMALLGEGDRTDLIALARDRRTREPETRTSRLGALFRK